MLRTFGNIVSPAGARARLAILTYHRVLARPDPLLDEVDREAFERQVEFLTSEFNVVPLGKALAALDRGTLPARAVSITFDDGYANNEEVALPILVRHRIPATFFIATGFLDGTAMFNDDVIEIVRSARAGPHDLSGIGLPSCDLTDFASRRRAIEPLLAVLKYKPIAERSGLVDRLAQATGGTRSRNLMMTPSQVRRLHEAGMEIGGHTVNHPILSRLEEADARREMLGGKRALEEITGAPVQLFAYPNGRPGDDYGPREVRLAAECGFTAAVSTRDGVASRRDDRFQLPRCAPWERDPRRFGVRLLLNCARRVAA
jgi:peptidoglycan/xylan/chitin deacetylase (PgdA/CDA1 family)